MKPFEETDRYDYPITPDSVVLDCGGYEGRWAKGIHEKYGCRIHVLEPIQEFFERTARNLSGLPGVEVYQFGIDSENRMAEFTIKGDMTGLWADGTKVEGVMLFAVESVFDNLGLDRLAVMKLNIEGSEFRVVESLITSGLINRVDNLQVQWHPVAPEVVEKFDELQKRLSETHELTFDAQWIWQNWRLKA